MNTPYLFYDIVVEGNEAVKLYLYEYSKDRLTMDKLFLDLLFYTGSIDLSDNKKEDIERQKELGYVSVQHLFPNFNVKTDNINTKWKLMSLVYNNSLLEKVYDANFILDGFCVIKKYIRYVNVNTGEVYAMEIGTENWSEENIESLKNEGYVDIIDSPLFDVILEIDNMSLNRKIKCSKNRTIG